jgi:hypothetical protein
MGQLAIFAQDCEDLGLGGQGLDGSLHDRKLRLDNGDVRGLDKIDRVLQVFFGGRYVERGKDTSGPPCPVGQFEKVVLRAS